MGDRLTRAPGRSGPDLPTAGEYLRLWSHLHGGAPTTGLIGWWLRFSYRIAVPLARRRVSPDTVTLLGLVVASAVPVVAGLGGRWAVTAVALVAVSGLLDNLDGAVAVLTDRTTRWGAVLDAVCDRLADAAYVGALGLLGAPGPVCAAAVAVAWLHEYIRARSAVAGMTQVGVVTVSERPTRVIVAAMFLLGAGLYPAAAPTWGSAGAWSWCAVGAVGLAQLVVAVRRRLR